MRDMQYVMSSFSQPTGTSKTDQKKWDLAFLDKSDFVKKYGLSEFIRMTSARNN